MRHDEHPRTWAEIRLLLDLDEAMSFTSFLREHFPALGLTAATVEPCDLERLFTEWRQVQGRE